MNDIEIHIIYSTISCTECSDIIPIEDEASTHRATKARSSVRTDRCIQRLCQAARLEVAVAYIFRISYGVLHIWPLLLSRGANHVFLFFLRPGLILFWKKGPGPSAYSKYALCAWVIAMNSRSKQYCLIRE